MINCLIRPLRMFGGTQIRGIFGLVNTRNVGDQCVAMSDDGRVVAFWHPEQPILYEHTKPVPKDVLSNDTSVLKRVNMNKLRKTKPDALVREELMALTYTTKHKWFPRSRDKRFRKFPRDRVYI